MIAFFFWVLSLRKRFADAQMSMLEELRPRLAASERWRSSLTMQVYGDVRETEWHVSPYHDCALNLVFAEDAIESSRRERLLVGCQSCL